MRTLYINLFGIALLAGIVIGIWQLVVHADEPSQPVYPSSSTGVAHLTTPQHAWALQSNVTDIVTDAMASTTGVTFGTSTRGPVIQFTGASTPVQLGVNSTLEYTICLWAKVGAFFSNGVSTWISTAEYQVESAAFLGAASNGGGLIFSILGAIGSCPPDLAYEDVTYPYSSPLAWHHVCFSRRADLEPFYRLSVDGENNMYIHAGTYDWEFGTELQLGGQSCMGVASASFQGLAIWDYYIPDDQVHSVYTKQLNGSDFSLDSWT